MNTSNDSNKEKELLKEIEDLKEIIISLSSATGVVDNVLRRNIEWVDWKQMPKDARIKWSNDARLVLNNRTFQALCGSIDRDGIKSNGELVKNLIEYSARYAKDYSEVERLRMTINGIELIREKLEEMLFEERQPSKNNVLDAI